MSDLSRLAMIVALALSITGLPDRSANARDLEDILEGVATEFGLSTGLDHSFGGLGTCGTGGPCLSVNLTGFSDLSDFNATIVNDRVVPLSSSVTGFTYEYNEDLDIYERSTKTFGPLFSERADTIGRGRIMAGLSYSFFEFDEFEGESLSSLSASSTTGEVLGIDRISNIEIGGVTKSLQGKTVADVRNLFGGDTIDIVYDLDIKETVATFQFTYGLTDRIDLGFVLPVLRIDFKASAITTISQDVVPSCDNVGLSVDPCIATASTASVSESEEYFGIGDLVVRGKWHFLSSFMDAAALLSATIPTGSPENLTGFHTMTVKPGLVMSRDFETSWGGFGIHSILGYEYRPDISNKDEFEWALGFAIQPSARASLNFDVLGSEKVNNTSVGQSRRDLSIGGKFMLFPGVLADLNVILPLNDDGLRPDAIYTAQLEWVFGD